MSTFPAELLRDAEELIGACRQAGVHIATAESCTGGLIAGCLTSVAGSSDVVDGGFVTYSNEAKQQMLGVPEDLIARHGAVSREVAEAMARGALERSAADIAVAVTGIAGPGGGSAEKPVGLVQLACAGPGGALRHQSTVFPGDRQSVRLATVEAALSLLGQLVVQP